MLEKVSKRDARHLFFPFCRRKESRPFRREKLKGERMCTRMKAAEQAPTDTLGCQANTGTVSVESTTQFLKQGPPGRFLQNCSYSSDSYTFRVQCLLPPENILDNIAKLSCRIFKTERGPPEFEPHLLCGSSCVPRARSTSQSVARRSDSCTLELAFSHLASAQKAPPHAGSFPLAAVCWEAVHLLYNR